MQVETTFERKRLLIDVLKRTPSARLKLILVALGVENQTNYIEVTSLILGANKNEFIEILEVCKNRLEFGVPKKLYSDFIKIYNAELFEGRENSYNPIKIGDKYIDYINYDEVEPISSKGNIYTEVEPIILESSIENDLERPKRKSGSKGKKWNTSVPYKSRSKSRSRSRSKSKSKGRKNSKMSKIAKKRMRDSLGRFI